MKIFQLEIDCLMEGGEVLKAVVDQRDHAAFEASDLFDTAQPGSVLKVRWLAWHALKREKKVTGPEASWPKFNGELCVQAVVTKAPGDDESEQEGEQEPDPSQT